MAKKSKKTSPKQADTSVARAELRLLQDMIKEARITQEKLSEASERFKNAASMNEEQSRNLIENMNMLVTRLDKIFTMFEEASKHVGDVETAEAKIANLSTKLESLLEQNKAIAQGLILLEKYVRGKTRLEPAIQPKPLE